MNTRNIDPQVLQIFGQLLHQTHDVFVVFDAHWNFIFANRRACNYFSDGQELAGRNLMTEFPVYKNTKLIDSMEQARKNSRPTEFEQLSPFSKRWMYFRVYPLDGLLAVYATDINLRKEAQRTIQQNQERYFNFISQSTEGIWRYELEEPIPIDLPAAEQIDRVYQHAYLAECNDAMAKMYGFRDAYDLMGSRLEMLLPRNEENLAYLHAFIESGYRLTDAESKEIARDGSTKYMLNNLIGIVENGHVARAWGTQRDITPIKEVEEKLKNAQEQLNLALSAGSAGTFIWNIQTNEVQWTREEEALYGLPEGAFGGSLDNWARTVHPDDLQGAQESLWHAINTKTELDIEFRIIWPDGSVHWILARGKVFYNDKGEPERMIGINIDITNRRGSSDDFKK
jgi:PAS domain S-box-containing protein